MIERRRVYDVKLGNGDTMFRIVLESHQCPQIGPMSTMIKAEMLKAIGNNLDLVSSENSEFESLEMTYKQDRWVIVAKIIKLKEK